MRGALNNVNIKMKEKGKKERLQYWEILIPSSRQLAGGLPERTRNFGGENGGDGRELASCLVSTPGMPDPV